MHEALEHPLGKYRGYNPSFVAKAVKKKQFVPSRSLGARMLRQFRQGMDTMQIAGFHGVSEAEVERRIHAARSNEADKKYQFEMVG